MKYVAVSFALLSVLVMASVGMSMPGKPDFNEHIYADGVAWGTKVTTALPSANDFNMDSFDKLFVITNSNNPEPQLPVGEAGPGNPDYNGGRWYTQTVMWTEAGFSAHGTVPILKSYDDIMTHYNLGHLTITAGPPDAPGAPPAFFSCPLLPVK